MHSWTHPDSACTCGPLMRRFLRQHHTEVGGSRAPREGSADQRDVFRRVGTIDSGCTAGARSSFSHSRVPRRLGLGALARTSNSSCLLSVLVGMRIGALQHSRLLWLDMLVFPPQPKAVFGCSLVERTPLFQYSRPLAARLRVRYLCIRIFLMRFWPWMSWICIAETGAVTFGNSLREGRAAARPDLCPLRRPRRASPFAEMCE